MKRFALIAAFVSLFYMIAGVSPANAASFSEVHCHFNGGSTVTSHGFPVNYGFDTCVTVVYRVQDDGDGLRAEDMYVDINRNCGDLEPGHQWSNGKAWMESRSSSFVFSSTPVFGVGGQGCHFHRDIELVGADTGGSQFGFKVDFNINNADKVVHDSWLMDICNGGPSVC